MACLDGIITGLADVFTKYANDDGMLDKKELMQLIEAECPEAKDKLSEDVIDKVMKKVDRNKDGKLNFNQFSRCVSIMARRHYHQKTGKCQEDDE